MKAATIEVFGEPLVVGDTAEAVAGPGEVLVRLTHASVNPLDVRMAEGGAGRVALPFVPGCDGVGQLDGAPVAVYGSGIGLQRPGTYAERIAVPAVSVVPVPAGLGQEQAAGLGLAAATAWAIVRHSAGITADDRVLVLGATGGVGSLVVQLTRSIGARVWSQVADPSDVDLQRELGAEDVVVVEAGELAAAVCGLRPTVVIDGLGGDFTGAAVRSVTPGGRVLVFGAGAGSSGTVDLGLLYRKAVTIRGHASLAMSPAEASTALAGCLSLAAGGSLRALVDTVRPLDEVNVAHDAILGRAVSGKILLSMTAG